MTYDNKRTKTQTKDDAETSFHSETKLERRTDGAQVGGENPTREYHLLKGLLRFSADLNVHSFFILGLELDSKSTRREDYSAYKSLSNQVVSPCLSLLTNQPSKSRRNESP